jgi:hypothetical protein
MIKHNLRFFVLVLALTALLIPFNYFVVEAVFGQHFGMEHYLTYVYFAIVTLIIQGFLVKSLESTPQRFVVNFMAAMGLKIFVSLALLGLHLYFNKGEGKLYAVNFTLLYLAYVALGTYSILRLQGKKGSE